MEASDTYKIHYFVWVSISRFLYFIFSSVIVRFAGGFLPNLVSYSLLQR